MSNGNGRPAQAPNMPQIPAVGVFDPNRGNVDYFAYPAFLASLLNTDPATPVQVQISADSDFYWNATTYAADIAQATLTEATNVVPLITVQITDNGSNRNIFNTALPIQTIAGRGEWPYRLVHPRFFSRSTSFTVTFTNYSGAVNNDYANIYLVLHGFKVYSQG